MELNNKLYAKGKIHKIFNNGWGLTIVINSWDHINSTWVDYRLVIFKKTQPLLVKVCLELKEQQIIHVYATKSDKGKYVLKQFQLEKEKHESK